MQTKTAPVPNDETLEMFEFMDAAQRSLAAHGALVKLQARNGGETRYLAELAAAGWIPRPSLSGALRI
jgi:hypothetical protein